VGWRTVLSTHGPVTEGHVNLTPRSAVDPRTAVDVVIAVLLGTFSLIGVVAESADPPPGERPADALAYGIVVLAALALVWRRRAPVTVLAVVTVLVSVFWLLGYASLLSLIGLPALYSAAAYSEDRRLAWVAVVTSSGTLLAVASLTVFDLPEGYELLTAVSMAAFLAAGIAAGVVMRNRERIFVDSERRAALAEADRVAEAERAVASERARIAREMHDVVAHGMSVIAVQAAAGQAIVHTDPDRAADVFARIEAVGRESLGELRRMLGVLRDGRGETASLSPQPGLAEVADAVVEASASGVTTELVVVGERRDLPPGVELAAYRIVQEALTNVLKHAGGSATARVRLTYEPDELVVEVTDDGRGAVTSLFGPGSGHGLIGMRERVAIYGGTLSAGPHAGGGYRVRAGLPVQHAEGVPGTDRSQPGVAGAPSTGTRP
jgi:signal transduction histidine kinase